VKKDFAAHAYPRKVHYVESLPKTASGKIQRLFMVPAGLNSLPHRDGHPDIAKHNKAPMLGSSLSGMPFTIQSALTSATGMVAVYSHGVYVCTPESSVVVKHVWTNFGGQATVRRRNRS